MSIRPCGHDDAGVHYSLDDGADQCAQCGRRLDGLPSRTVTVASPDRGRRGLLTKAWAYADQPEGTEISVLTVDMECPLCHACGVVIHNHGPRAIAPVVCPCVRIEMRKVR